MLRRLAEYIEKTVKLRAQVKQAMIYPVAIVIFAIVVAIFLLWKVIPVFASIFIELGAELPALTAFIVALSNFVQSYIIFIFLGTIAFILLFRYYRKTPGRPLDRRPHAAQTAALRQAPAQGLHLARDPDPGYPHLGRRPDAREPEDYLLDGRERPHRNQILETRRLVSEGKTLHESLKEAGTFPLMMTQMVNVGEATGTLDEMLTKLANFYDDEVETSVAALLSIMEPLLLIFVGGIVGSLVISMYLPIFSLMNKF